jgi:hypothetical protein
MERIDVTLSRRISHLRGPSCEWGRTQAYWMGSITLTNDSSIEVSPVEFRDSLGSIGSSRKDHNSSAGRPSYRTNDTNVN